ncbi:MAG: tetratricopeptide repeat protein [Thiohalomonadales bacterium]
MQEANWNEAIRTATKALQADPNSDLAYVFRAWAYIEMGKVDQALVDLGIALEINPDSGIAYNNRAYAFQFKKDFERAKSDYWTACDLDFENGCHNLFMLMGTIPENILNDIVMLLQYSTENLSVQQWGNVIAASTQILLLDPKNTAALTNRARALAEVDYLVKALSDSDKAIRIDQDFAIAYYNRAYIYSLMDQAQAALAEYKLACNMGVKESCKELDRLHASNKHR